MDFVEAILEALGNEKFRKFVVDNMNATDSEPLEFCVGMIVYHLKRKSGKWEIGYFPDKEVCWNMIIKGEAIIISV